jgi:hypothetical protein
MNSGAQQIMLFSKCCLEIKLSSAQQNEWSGEPLASPREYPKA